MIKYDDHRCKSNQVNYILNWYGTKSSLTARNPLKIDLMHDQLLTHYNQVK